MSRHHTIITGTGRAGTTFLVQLLTALHLDTGFSSLDESLDANCNAGMEWDPRNANAPYVVKNPWLCDYLDEWLDDDDVIIDQAIIPVRDLFPAAESRRDVVRRSSSDLPPSEIPGGLWHTTEPEKQETVLTQQLYKIIHAIAKRDIPVTFLYFPRLIYDPQYLYGKLHFLLSDLGYAQFLEVFHQIAKPELVHDFKAETPRQV